MIRIKSPLTKNDNTTLVKKISKDEIIKKYKSYNIDVARYFKEITNIEIYKCNDTGYLFYYPLTISGDSKFYEHFQNFDWYYMPWKWEHELTLQYINPKSSILEIGCAHGAFLKKVSSLIEINTAVGLELNETTVKKDNNWEIKNESIQSYSLYNKESFDMVCSFQVLEHISDVHGFLESKIQCLKTNGTLIISVPNNESFIKNENNCLNMPPHHMGLWDNESLKNLEKIFPIRLLKIHCEELQTYHIDSYIFSESYSKYPNLIAKIIRKIHIVLGIYKKRYEAVLKIRKKLLGQTILAVYKKIN